MKLTSLYSLTLICVSMASSWAAPGAAQTVKQVSKRLPSHQLLVPSKELPQITIPQDTTLRVVADHESQGVFSPTALTIDEQGRILVAETWRFVDNRGIDDNRQRRYWILDDVASQTTADRMAMYEKWYSKHPPEHYTRYSEKIRMLYDFDANGVAQKHTIFADGFNNPLDGTAAGIFSYNGNVYFACIPHIWLLKDENGDGVADVRESIQDGFGVRVGYSGHDLNGFAFGTDGRIYATIGDRGFNIKTKEGKHYAYPEQGAILRFEPDGSNMEVVHIGLRNPKEIAFDQFGNGISVDNNSDQKDLARVVYLMEGADSGWRTGHQILHSFHRTAGLETRPINRWMQEKMWQPQDETNRELQPAYIIPPVANLTSGPSGLTYHPGPKAYPGKPGYFFISDYKGSAKNSNILSFALEEEGAGMKVSEDYIFNNGVAVTDVEYGYNGKLYVSDFIEGWKAHPAGRIYALTKKATSQDPVIQQVSTLVQQDFATFSLEKLTTLLRHPDMRIRLRAQFALAHKKEIQTFSDVLSSQEELFARLHSIWGLGMIARGEGAVAEQATAVLVAQSGKSTHAEEQAQIAKVLGEAHGADVSQALEQLFKNGSARTQSFAAISLGKIKHKPAFAMLVELLKRNDGKDPFLRHAGIMGLVGTGGIEQIVALKDDASVAVRHASVVALRHKRSPQLSVFLNDPSSMVRDEAIRAIHDLQISSVQPELIEILTRYVKDSGETIQLTPIMQRRLIHNAFRLGGDQNIQLLLDFIGSANSTIDLDQRKEAVRLLTIWNTPTEVDQSIGKWSPLQPRENKNLGAILQSKLPDLLANNSSVTADLFALSSLYQLKLDTLPVEKLIAFVKDESLDNKARAEALKLMAQNPPADFQQLLAGLVLKNDPILAIEALTLYVQSAPDNATELLIKATDMNGTVPLRQAAWKLIAEQKQLNAALVVHLQDALEKIASGKGDQYAALEILAAAKEHSELQEAYKKYEASLDSKNVLSPYLVTLFGGNAEKGAALFRSHPVAQCMRCHTTEENHDIAMAGPNLHGIGSKQDRLVLLESLVVPNAKVAEGFGKVSAMPPMGYLLKQEEIRDVVEYLSTLK